MVICCRNRMEHRSTLCGENSDFSMLNLTVNSVTNGLEIFCFVLSKTEYLGDLVEVGRRVTNGSLTNRA
jgi:hypothetical protein